jgi:ribosomal protein S6--L-glutamate ligase
MARHAAPGDWRTNVSLGGRAERYRPSADEERLALGAARSVGAEVAGVDLITDCDQDRPIVLEVNAVPGWRALSRVTGIDVAAAVLDALRRT